MYREGVSGVERAQVGKVAGSIPGGGIFSLDRLSLISDSKYLLIRQFIPWRIRFLLGTETSGSAKAWREVRRRSSFVARHENSFMLNSFLWWVLDLRRTTLSSSRPTPTTVESLGTI